MPVSRDPVAGGRRECHGDLITDGETVGGDGGERHQTVTTGVRDVTRHRERVTLTVGGGDRAGGGTGELDRYHHQVTGGHPSGTPDGHRVGGARRRRRVRRYLVDELRRVDRDVPGRRRGGVA